MAGLLLFGTGMALRRFFGMLRVDYIRVPGREWIPDPDERYSSIPIRAPLIRAVRRAEAAIVDDLPKAFHLPEGSLHREDVLPLPRKVLREALVNALMHRDYRVHGATQIIRYANRIEIRNPGYSLKSPERLGDPGSEARNPTIAAVFHDTNLAETKGTGIRVMRRLMREAELVPPTFESDRGANLFTARLLLHHFLGPDDLAWLDGLGVTGLSPEEKLVLVFVREVGAVDNATYRDLTGSETLKASAGLRHLCELGLLEKRGQSTATYYVPTPRLAARRGSAAAGGAESSMGGAKSSMVGAESSMVGGQPPMVHRDPTMAAAKPTMAEAEPTMVEADPTMAGARESGSGPSADRRRALLYGTLPEDLGELVSALGQHADEQQMRWVLRLICAWKAHAADELALLVGRNAHYLKRIYLRPMIRAGELRYTIPDMPKHPHQAYRATEGAR